MAEDGRNMGLLYSGRGQRVTPLSGDPWFTPLGFTQIFRRSLLAFDCLWAQSKDQNTDGEPLAHDQWYYMLASALGVVVYVSVPLANYRRHSANTSAMSFYWLRFRGLTHLLRATRARHRVAMAALNRAHLFRQAAQQRASPWRREAAEAARWYDQVHAFWLKRTDIYDGSRLTRRTSALLRLVAAEGYGPFLPSFSRSALAMDSIIGVSGLFRLLERLRGNE
jgi:hypothetical protein